MADELFHEVADTWVITRARGVYRQSKVYKRGSGVFAGQGSGFVKLFSSGGTSAPNVSWVDFEPKNAVKIHALDLGLGPGITLEDRSPSPAATDPQQGRYWGR